MLIIKGFTPHAGLANNTPGVVNPVGELSTFAQTYTLEKGIYVDAAVSNQTPLIALLAENNGVAGVIPSAVATLVIRIAKAVYDYTLARPGTQIDHSDITSHLIATFSANVKNLTAGIMANDGTYYVPEWVDWTATDDTHQVRIWFSDSAIRLQYPDSAIRISAPFDNLDDFFLDGAEVVARLKALTPTILTERLQNLRGDKPESFIRMDSFDYHDPYNVSRIEPSPWGILIHGIAGNNLDSIKDALAEYILANSTHTRDEWKNILPDIFKRTEFVATPGWPYFGIPNLTGELGIHSPILSKTELDHLTEMGAVDYNAAYAKTNAEFFPVQHRSLVLSMVGGEENRDGKTKIRDYFPDYINVPMTHPDFRRMSQPTQDWVAILAGLISAAETFTRFSAIPADTMRVERGDIVYLSRAFQNVNFLVATKESILAKHNS